MKKIILTVILITMSIVIYNKISKMDLYPSECTETFYFKDINKISKFNKLKTRLQKGILNKNPKLVCFLGLNYHSPGLSIEEYKSMVKEHDAILICTGDITDNNHSEFIQKLYNYCAKYNQQVFENQ